MSFSNVETGRRWLRRFAKIPKRIDPTLEIIEKRGGDFVINAFSVQPNDQRTEFNFKRTSSVALTVMAVDTAGLDDITTRLQQLVNVLESAEGSLTVMPEAVA